MTNAIVTTNVTETVAPQPPSLQKTGVFLSQGATITSPGTLSLLTQFADLAPLLVGAKALSGLTWSGGFVTATTTRPHGIPGGSTMELTFSGSSPSGYNGTYLCTATGSSTLSYVRSNPGVMTVAGMYTPEDVSELNAMATTFFTQGSSVGVYVLELGAGTIESGVTALRAYLVANPEQIYVALVSRLWDANPAFLALIADYEATTAKFYFWITTNLQTRQAYTDQMKDVFTLVEAPQQHVFLGNALTALDYNGENLALSATVAAPGTGYAPGNVLTAGTAGADAPTLNVTHTQVVSAVVNSGGTGGTPGPATVTGTSGTGVKFQATGTINGSGTLSGPITLTVAGDYTVNPASLISAPVTGGGLLGATITVQMGVLTVALATAGAVDPLPANPLSTTVSPGGGNGATVNVSWQANALTGQITATTLTAHNVNVGDLFQLAGCIPNGYNTYYVAQDGTTGSTLVAGLYVNPGTVTVLGSLVPSTVVSAAPPASEFTLAAPFWNALHIDPSTTNKVAPFAFRYVFGVTNWVTKGNGAILQQLKSEAVNYISTGAEGGISNSCIFWGTVRQPLRDLTYWYSVDWAQIQASLGLANTIINGSNNPINPLYYDQYGIDRLQDSVVATMQTAVAVGLANGVPSRSRLGALKFIDALENGLFAGQINVNAVPFIAYLRDNPGDYAIGRYAGLSVVYTPNRGFISIVFNLNVTDFIVP